MVKQCETWSKNMFEHFENSVFWILWHVSAEQFPAFVSAMFRKLVEFQYGFIFQKRTPLLSLFRNRAFTLSCIESYWGMCAEPALLEAKPCAPMRWAECPWYGENQRIYWLCITICDHLWVALGFDPLRFWSSFSTLQHSLLMHFTLPFSVSHPSPNISAPSPRHSLMPKGFQSSHLLWMFMVCSSVLLPWVRRIHALTNGAKSSAQLPTWNANRAFAIQLTCDRHASEGHDVVLPTRVPLNMPRFFEQSSAVLYKTCLSQDRSASATWFIHWIQDLTWSNYHFFLPN